MRKADLVAAVLLIILLAAALVIGGFFAGWHFKSVRSDREWAERTYRTYEREGVICAGVDKEFWGRELKDQLQQALVHPWQAIIQDDAWGSAYSILRDRGPKTWGYSEGMSQAQQDEMIRYLCFLIGRAANASGTHDLLAINCSTSDGRVEFKSLLSYPKEAAKRNREMIRVAASAAVYSKYDQNRICSFAYLAQMTDLDWVRSIYQDCLLQGAHEPEDMLWLLDYLTEAAEGKQGVQTGALESGKPTAAVQAGASQVIAEFLQSDWSSCPKKSLIQSWRERLATASAPATRASQ